MGFSFHCVAITHIGNRRKNNEDNFFIGNGEVLSPAEQQSMSPAGCTSIKKSMDADNAVNRIYAVS